MTGRQDVVSVPRMPRLSLVRASVAILGLRGDRAQESRAIMTFDTLGMSRARVKELKPALSVAEEERGSLSPWSLVCVGVISVLVSCPWLMCHCHCCVCHHVMWKCRVEWTLDTFYLCDTLLSIEDYTQILKRLGATGLPPRQSTLLCQLCCWRYKIGVRKRCKDLPGVWKTYLVAQDKGDNFVLCRKLTPPPCPRSVRGARQAIKIWAEEDRAKIFGFHIGK